MARTVNVKSKLSKPAERMRILGCSAAAHLIFRSVGGQYTLVRRATNWQIFDAPNRNSKLINEIFMTH